MKAAIYEATANAKADKAYYLKHIRNELKCDQRTAMDLYQMGKVPALFPMPAIARCYCGYPIEAHKDRIPCDHLGFFNYG